MPECGPVLVGAVQRGGLPESEPAVEAVLAASDAAAVVLRTPYPGVVSLEYGFEG